MADYKWEPIKPLSKAEEQIDLGSLKPLYESWRLSHALLNATSAKSLRSFNERLVRRLSIETGILERIYNLDTGTTEALVAHGFAEDLVFRSSTDIEPSRLIDILRDQEAAIKLVVDCVATKRPITKGLIHELQALLTRHQSTSSARDTLGNHLEIPLIKGAYKKQPNNPVTPNGDLHEYCPPVHVDSEMDNLLKWLESYEEKDPVLVTTWLHHRFTQIHPYQDGNGRVSRAIATLVLLRAGLLPLVVDRSLRVEYIDALGLADSGDLSRLALLFARLEKNAILQALSVDADNEIAHQESLTAAVIQSLSDKFHKRLQNRSATLRQVNGIAKILRSQSATMLKNLTSQVRTSLAVIDNPQIQVAEGGTDKDNGHWYRFEVSKSARDAGKFANLTEDHYFVKTTIRLQRERLVFVLSFHHAGRELSGIMEATSFAKLESYDDSEDRQLASEFVICSMDPFVFTNTTKPDGVSAAFGRWLDEAFAIAVRQYGEKL